MLKFRVCTLKVHTRKSNRKATNLTAFLFFTHDGPMSAKGSSSWHPVGDSDISLSLWSDICEFSEKLFSACPAGIWFWHVFGIYGLMSWWWHRFGSVYVVMISTWLHIGEVSDVLLCTSSSMRSGNENGHPVNGLKILVCSFLYIPGDLTTLPIIQVHVRHWLTVYHPAKVLGSKKPSAVPEAQLSGTFGVNVESQGDWSLLLWLVVWISVNVPIILLVGPNSRGLLTTSFSLPTSVVDLIWFIFWSALAISTRLVEDTLVVIPEDIRDQQKAKQYNGVTCIVESCKDSCWGGTG